MKTIQANQSWQPPPRRASVETPADLMLKSRRWGGMYDKGQLGGVPGSERWVLLC